MRRTILTRAALYTLAAQASADVEVVMDDEPVADRFVEPFNAPIDPLLSARAERQMRKTQRRIKKAFRP